MKPLPLTVEQKATAFDRIAALCIEEMEGAAELSETTDGREDLSARGSYLKNAEQEVFEVAMMAVYGENVFDAYSGFFE